MTKLSFEEYCEYVRRSLDSSDKYIEGVQKFLERENISFSELVDNLPYYEYQCRYYPKDHNKHTAENLASYLAKISELLHARSRDLEIKVIISKNLEFDHFVWLNSQLNELGEKTKLSFEEDPGISIRKIKKGSLIVTLTISGVILAIHAGKAIREIRKAIEIKKEGKEYRPTLGKGVLSTILVLLEVFKVFASLGPIEIDNSVWLTIDLIAELFDFFF